MAGIRLRCRAHNQYAAECTFGPEFMRHKRLAAAESRAASRVRATADHVHAPGATHAATNAERAAMERARDLDVVPWLRGLGFSAPEAKQAATLCDDLPDDASLEQRVRAALSHLRPRGTRVVPAAPRNPGALGTGSVLGSEIRCPAGA